MPEEHKPLTEEEIRRIVREEVRNQIQEMIREMRLLAGVPQRTHADLERKDLPPWVRKGDNL